MQLITHKGQLAEADMNEDWRWTGPPEEGDCNIQAYRHKRSCCISELSFHRDIGIHEDW